MQNLAGGQGAGWHASGTPGKPSEGMLLKLAGKLPAGVLVELGCEPRWIQPLPCPQEEAERTAAPPAPSPEDPCRAASPRRRAILRSCPSITARSGSDGWFALKRLAGVVLKWVVRTLCSFWIVTHGCSENAP